jgi:hypothetical protein
MGVVDWQKRVFSCPKDKPDTKGQPHLTMLYMSKGLLKNYFDVDVMNNL